MFFHFIELLFVAGLSPNEVVSAPQTNLQRRFRGDGDHDNQTYPYNQTDPYAAADSAADASSDHASLVRRAVIGSVVGGVGLMSFLFLGFFFLRRRRRRRLAALKVLEEEKDGAVVHRDLRHSESEEGTSTEEHFVVTGKNMVRLVPPPGHADEGPSGRRHDEPPPAYHG
ncbi:hypothetical protein ARMSODRAFT_955992 [Armillaria solidipes]|uniref:Transmembrane protein n=1 Tax=Armillaria solidipes TaxID=1076256 RepID=A0A2H3BI43_9AGAR|nr:hypothetical protein ARMSODRAFT_955992 [Armillaria solidipes]